MYLFPPQKKTPLSSILNGFLLLVAAVWKFAGTKKKQKHCSGLTIQEETSRLGTINFLKHHRDHKSGFSSVRPEAHRVWPLLTFCILRIPTTNKGISLLLQAAQIHCLFEGFSASLKWDDPLQSDDNFNCKISKPFLQLLFKLQWVIWPLDLPDVVTRALLPLSFQQFSNSKLKSTQVGGWIFQLLDLRVWC